MTPRPTYDDANLILHLYDMRREDRMRRARAWFTANFKVKTWDELQKLAPGGSDENASFRMVVTTGTWWPRSSPAACSTRSCSFRAAASCCSSGNGCGTCCRTSATQYKDPHSVEHLETVGNEFATAFKDRSSDAYGAFLKRIKG